MRQVRRWNRTRSFDFSKKSTNPRSSPWWTPGTDKFGVSWSRLSTSFEWVICFIFLWRGGLLPAAPRFCRRHWNPKLSMPYNCTSCDHDNALPSFSSINNRHEYPYISLWTLFPCIYFSWSLHFRFCANATWRSRYTFTFSLMQWVTGYFYSS